MAIIFAILALFGAAMNPNEAVGSDAGTVSTQQDIHFTRKDGKVSMQDFHFTQKNNSSSPKL